jgi:hypothetical protein
MCFRTGAFDLGAYSREAKRLSVRLNKRLAGFGILDQSLGRLAAPADSGANMTTDQGGRVVTYGTGG